MVGKITTRKKLFEANKRYWGTCDYSGERGYICVAHTIPFILKFNMVLDIRAKGIQDEEKLPVVGFSVGSNFDSFKEGDESFGFTGLNYDLVNDYLRKFDKDELLEEIVNRCYEDKDAVLNLEYRDIRCGDSLWEELIANSPYLDASRITKDAFIFCVKKVLAAVDLAYEIFEKYPPKYFLIDEPVRYAGVFPLVAAQVGARIVTSRIELANYFMEYTPSDFSLRGLFAREGNMRVRAVINKKRESEIEEYVYEISEETNYNLDVIKNRKLNVFIMLHQFNDATREACDHYIYRDYLEWFSNTLEIIKDIPEVNWIIRDHPFGRESLQRKVVREIFDRYESENIIWCDYSVPRENIVEKADVVITYCGDVGLEYWAQGTPTVTLSNAYYANFGISHRMKSYEEYVETLHHLDKLALPSEESKAIAKKIISNSWNMLSAEDRLANLFNSVWRKNMYGNRYVRMNYDLYEFELIQGYLKLLEEDVVRKSDCYLLNNRITEAEG